MKQSHSSRMFVHLSGVVISSVYFMAVKICAQLASAWGKGAFSICFDVRFPTSVLRYTSISRLLPPIDALPESNHRPIIWQQRVPAPFTSRRSEFGIFLSLFPITGRKRGIFLLLYRMLTSTVGRGISWSRAYRGRISRVGRLAGIFRGCAWGVCRRVTARHGTGLMVCLRTSSGAGAGQTTPQQREYPHFIFLWRRDGARCRGSNRGLWLILLAGFLVRSRLNTAPALDFSMTLMIVGYTLFVSCLLSPCVNVAF